jgi:hypothetical protein
MNDNKNFTEINQNIINERRKKTPYYINLMSTTNPYSYFGTDLWSDCVKNINDTHNTQRWNGTKFVDYEYDIKDNYCLYDFLKMTEPILVEGPSFKYKINESGFRSKDFKEFNKNNLNIVFSGCSITAGVGLPEEYTWYKKLYNKIAEEKTDKEINFYNLALNGSSIFLMYKNLITFIRTVGKPDYIFLLIPNMSRHLVYDKTSETYTGVNYLVNPVREQDIEYKENYSYEDSLLLTTTLMNSLEALCDLSDIKLIWSSWIPEDTLLFNDLKFKYFLNFKQNLFTYTASPLDPFQEDNQTKKDKDGYKTLVEFLSRKNKNNEPYWHSAREGHPGTYFTNVCSDKYFQEFKRRGL